MKRFRKILFFAHPLDNAEAALRQALSVYDLNNSQFTLLEVARDISSSFVEAGIVSDQMREELLAERRARAKGLVQKLEAPGEIDIKLLTGIPFIEVIQEIIRNQYDLLIKPAEGGSAVARLIGSTDMHLLRKCPCPVWIVKPTRKHKHRKILAAVDPDPKDANSELNRAILDLASSISAEHNAELHVVAAWDLAGHFELRPNERDNLRREVKKAAKGWLANATAPFVADTSAMKTHLLEGRASEVILKQAKRHAADLIVMGTVGRTGIPGYFIGNTAERILAGVNCSILAVKPPGFQSPVEV